MANFVKQMYPPGVSIALNDLGAISFYNDARILDLVGLGSLDVARAKQRKDFNTGFIKQLLVSNKVDFIMVYPQWFMGEWALPEDTARIADWITSNNFWDETVSFYAFTKENQKTLYDRLKQYQSHLPDSVQVNYFYTDSDPSIDEISPTTMPLHRL